MVNACVEVIWSVSNDEYQLSVYRDINPDSPREWFNIGTMVCAHNRYVLGDEQVQNLGSYSGWQAWLESKLLFEHGDDLIYLPLYLYDHSGITMNTTGFSCEWDSGQVGWIYATKQRFRDETTYSDKELFEEGMALQMLKNEVETYDDFLTGNAYGFMLEKITKCDHCGSVDYEIEDSCWGFYGTEHLVDAIAANISSEYSDLIELLRQEVR